MTYYVRTIHSLSLTLRLAPSLNSPFFLKNSRFSLFVESDSYGWGSPAFSRFHTQIEHHMLSVMDAAIDGKTLYKWSSLCS